LYWPGRCGSMARFSPARPAISAMLIENFGFSSQLVGCRIIQASPMKAYVYVSLKRSVLDPQGKTIQGALQKLGYQGLQDVRQGKFFELTLDGGLDKAQADTAVGKIAREVLTNPVIEEFRYSIEE
jgi:phosphoribosylformylglycinamidine synthase subunit PurS